MFPKDGISRVCNFFIVQIASKFITQTYINTRNLATESICIEYTKFDINYLLALELKISTMTDVIQLTR